MFISSQKDKSFFTLFPFHIAVLAAGEHCIEIFTASGKKHVIDGTLDTAHQWFRERHLPFIRVHRSYIVNFNFVKKIEDDKIIFEDEFLQKLHPDEVEKIKAINMTKAGWEDYEACSADFTRHIRRTKLPAIIHPASNVYFCSIIAGELMPSVPGKAKHIEVYYFSPSNSSSGTV